MRPFTSAELLKLLFATVDSSNLITPRTVQTWPPAIIIYFVIWKRICAEPDFVMNELRASTEGWFQEQTKDFYYACIASLKDKWTKCIEVGVDYIEK